MRRVKIRTLVLLCAAAILLPRAFGEEARVSFPDNPRYTVQRLEDQFGLGAVTVTSMGQDAQGFLWIGTQTGLFRYDGARAQKMTEVETLIGHYVVDLLIAPDGTPWFAGNHGLAHYKNGVFESLAIPSTAMPLASGNQIFAVDSKGIVYLLLFNRGILRIDPKRPSEAKVLGVMEGMTESAGGIVRAADDSIWFTFRGRLAHIASESSNIEIDPAIRVPEERVVALVFDGAKTMWLRSTSHLMRVDRRLHRISMEAAVTGSANDEEGKPSVDGEGRLMVPSAAGLFWQENGRWRVITEKQGISSNEIQCALEDREGTLWIAGSGTGLDRLPGVHEWSSWTTAEGMPANSTWATLRDHAGRLWVSTGGGIGIWDGRAHRWERITALGGHPGAEVRQLQLAWDGSVWVLTATGGVVRIDPKSFATTAHWSYGGRAFLEIRAAPDGNIWATTHTHLVRFDVRKFAERPIKIALPAGEERDIEYMSFSPKGVLWATGPGVVYRFDGRSWRTFAVRDGLQGRRVTSLVALSDDEVWVGYNDVVKVTRLQLNARGVPGMEHFTWDWAIIGRDSQNRVWFDGTDGITIRAQNGRLQRINHADGLLWDDVSPWTGVREERDGSYVIATSRGMSRYRPLGRPKEEKQPNVILTSVALGGKEQRPGVVPEVSSSEGTLKVQFTPMILDNPERMTCRYLLKGLETQYTQTNLREVQYGGLPAGSYDFQVQCRPTDSMSMAASASFRFRVLPKIWQSWWARLAGGALLLAAFWGFVSLRTRALQRRKWELEQAVAQRSAELLQKNKELAEISLTDPLTGTRNRRYFYETISTDVAQMLRSHSKAGEPQMPTQPAQELIFVLVDIDRFKQVNDDLGHAAGDRLLQEAAKRIASVMRRSDDLVRWGGEEFLLVCRTTDRENASTLCIRVMEAVRDIPFDVGNGVPIHKTCSIGWAPFPWMLDDVNVLSIDNVIELADKALYMAKREGRNRAYGMLPSAEARKPEKGISIEKLRDCPPDLVQIV